MLFIEKGFHIVKTHLKQLGRWSSNEQLSIWVFTFKSYVPVISELSVALSPSLPELAAAVMSHAVCET